MADYSIDDILAELDSKKTSDEPKNITDTTVFDIINGLGGDETDAILQGSSKKVTDRSVDAVLMQTDRFSITEGDSKLIAAAEAEKEAEALAQKLEAEKPKEPEVQVKVETPEEREARLKAEEEHRAALLQHERENSDPDAMLDLINPIDVKAQAKEKAKEKEKEKAVPKLATTNELDNPPKKPEATRIIPELPVNETETTAEVKEYPATKKQAPDKTTVASDTLVQKINESIGKKREEDVKVYHTITITNARGKAPTVARPLNLDAKTIIESTGPLMSENPVVEQEKAAEFANAKKRRIKNFVIEDGTEDDDYDLDMDDNEEFSDYDSGRQIMADLQASHKGLKVRMVPLLAVTLFSLLAGIINDFSLYKLPLFKDGPLSFLSFMYIDRDPTPLMYVYIICGIIGMVICGTVIAGGIGKLLRGRPDCDTLCAVTCVLALVGSVVSLIEIQSFRLMHSYIYITAALVALVFNNIGKMYMIVRAKRNFRFVSGDSQKYYSEIVSDSSASSAFTKGAVKGAPKVAVMRKTEFLTDFLKLSYCDDDMDRLSVKILPIALLLSLIAGVMAFFNPFGVEFINQVPGENPIFWALTAFIATFCVASPIAILLVINRPLAKASKKLVRSRAVILGYDTVEEFSDVNSVLIDAKTLFPKGSIELRNVKNCQQKTSATKITVDESLIMAASIAIQADSVLSHMFRGILGDNTELLKKVDNCIYEDNCGITAWIDTKRVMFGGRKLMEMHDIEVPSMAKERKHCKSDGDEVIYLAVGGEIVLMLIVFFNPNPVITETLRRLRADDIAISVHTVDSIITSKRLSELFGIDEYRIKVLSHETHEQYTECTKFTSKGSGGISGNGNLSSFVSGILTAKKLMRIFSSSKFFLLGASAFGALFTLFLITFRQTSVICPSVIIGYNLLSALVLVLIQKLTSK